MNATLKLGFSAVVCAGLMGCIPLGGFGVVVLPAGGAPFDAIVEGLKEAAHTAAADRARSERCRELTAKGYIVIAIEGAPSPTDEGVVKRFEPSFWLPEFGGEGRPQVRGFTRPIEGTFTLTDRSVYFSTMQRTPGLRIPYEVVDRVEIDPMNPHAVHVTTVCGQFETFTFWHGQTATVDQEGARTAAATIEERVASLHATAAIGPYVPK